MLFEAVGVPGRLDSLMREAPSRSQIVVVGVCMEPDRIEPSIGVMKQQTISFALGWTAEEFRDSLDAIGGGDVDAGALITGRVGLEGAAAAFDELGRPEHHVKILVLPGATTGSSARHRSGSAVDHGHAIAEAQQGGAQLVGVDPAVPQGGGHAQHPLRIDAVRGLPCDRRLQPG